MMMAVNPEKKERTIRGDRYDLVKDPLMIKSVFSLGHKDEKQSMVRTYLWQMGPTSFIERLTWVYLFRIHHHHG